MLLIKDPGARAGEAFSWGDDGDLQTTASVMSLFISGGIMPQTSKGKAAAADPPALGGRGAFGQVEHRAWGWELQSPTARGNVEVSSPPLLSSLRCSVSRTTQAGFQQQDMLLAALYGFMGLILFACGALAGNSGFGVFVWALGDAAVRIRSPRQQQCQGKITILGRLRCHRHSRLIICLRIT